MAALTDTRKRSREDDNCDFMPLSKRINNLHINNVTTMIVNQAQPPQDQIPPGETFREEVGNEPVAPPPYNPGITSSQSSYYFENKLLYELYLERLQRNGQQSPY